MYNLYFIQTMRHWTSKDDYTAVAYEGTIPRRVIPTSEGVEILPKAREERREEFPNIKQAGGLIPVSMLVEKIQKAAQDSREEFLPVNNVIATIRDTAQFTLRSWVDSVPADVKRWPDPPHVEFANCTFDSPEDVKRFVEAYGFGAGMIHEPPKATGLWPTLDLEVTRLVEDYGFNLQQIYDEPQKKMTIGVERLKADQQFLRQSWGKTEQGQALRNSFLWSPEDIEFVNGKPRIIVKDIWDYILVLHLIDLSKGRLRVCQNSQCKQLKYFVQERRDQKYCSTSCKNTFHMNLWLAMPENREHWNAARRKSKGKAKPARRGGKS